MTRITKLIRIQVIFIYQSNINMDVSVMVTNINIITTSATPYIYCYLPILECSKSSIIYMILQLTN